MSWLWNVHEVGAVQGGVLFVVLLGGCMGVGWWVCMLWEMWVGERGGK